MDIYEKIEHLKKLKKFESAQLKSREDFKAHCRQTLQAAEMQLSGAKYQYDGACAALNTTIKSLEQIDKDIAICEYTIKLAEADKADRHKRMLQLKRDFTEGDLTALYSAIIGE